MLKRLLRARDRFLGTGDADTSTPVFDGPLQPNNALESAEVLLHRADLDDMCVDGQGRLFVSAGNAVLRVAQDGATELVAQWPQAVQALATFRGGLVAATRDELHFLGGALASQKVRLAVGGVAAACVNALFEAPDGSLLLSNGSQSTGSAQWSTDLLSRGRSGQVLAYAPEAGEIRILHQKMAHCFGVCADEGRVLTSESWGHRLLVLDGSRAQTGLEEIPGYPSRMAPAAGGGFWLTVFAPRSQLLEFVLREDAFRQEMMATIEPRYWIAPAYSSGRDFLEPMQFGGVRQMGILKPWAPPRSYGLVVRLGQDLLPLGSLHSRVGGIHHGITAVTECGDSLLVLSKGSNSILRLALPEISRGWTS